MNEVGWVVVMLCQGPRTTSLPKPVSPLVQLRRVKYYSSPLTGIGECGLMANTRPPEHRVVVPDL
jgi:hypothetical protein